MQKSFKEQCPKSHRPEITDLEVFWKEDIYQLFRRFSEFILQKYDLRFGTPVWTQTYGWTYRIGKSGVFLVKGIRIEENGFIVDGIKVHDKETYARILEYIEEIYQQNQDAFLERIARKNHRQAERNKARIAREKNEFASIQPQIVPDQYNVFCWPEKLNIHKLNRLYQLDAMGICDEVLADEIGLTLYLRCKYGKEDAERMEHSRIRCHGCGNELGGEADLRQCSCGRQYSFREYRRSFHRNNMPAGAAAKTFAAFLKEWETAKTYQEKILLIDALLHQFHLSMVSGAAHRPVAMNFIDGSRERVDQMISQLARNP